MLLSFSCSASATAAIVTLTRTRISSVACAAQAEVAASNLLVARSWISGGISTFEKSVDVHLLHANSMDRTLHMAVNMHKRVLKTWWRHKCMVEGGR